MMYEKELTDKLLLLLTTLGKHGMEMGEVTKVTLHETKPFRLRNYLANNFFLRIKFEVDDGGKYELMETGNPKNQEIFYLFTPDHHQYTIYIAKPATLLRHEMYAAVSPILGDIETLYRKYAKYVLNPDDHGNPL